MKPNINRHEIHVTSNESKLPFSPFHQSKTNQYYLNFKQPRDSNSSVLSPQIKVKKRLSQNSFPSTQFTKPLEQVEIFQKRNNESNKIGIDLSCVSNTNQNPHQGSFLKISQDIQSQQGIAMSPVSEPRKCTAHSRSNTLILDNFSVPTQLKKKLFPHSQSNSSAIKQQQFSMDSKELNSNTFNDIFCVPTSNMKRSETPTRKIVSLVENKQQEQIMQTSQNKTSEYLKTLIFATNSRPSTSLSNKSQSQLFKQKLTQKIIHEKRPKSSISQNKFHESFFDTTYTQPSIGKKLQEQMYPPQSSSQTRVTSTSTNGSTLNSSQRKNRKSGNSFNFSNGFYNQCSSSLQRNQNHQKQNNHPLNYILGSDISPACRRINDQILFQQVKERIQQNRKSPQSQYLGYINKQNNSISIPFSSSIESNTQISSPSSIYLENNYIFDNKLNTFDENRSKYAKNNSNFRQDAEGTLSPKYLNEVDYQRVQQKEKCMTQASISTSQNNSNEMFPQTFSKQKKKKQKQRKNKNNKSKIFDLSNNLSQLSIPSPQLVPTLSPNIQYQKETQFQQPNSITNQNLSSLFVNPLRLSNSLGNSITSSTQQQSQILSFINTTSSGNEDFVQSLSKELPTTTSSRQSPKLCQNFRKEIIPLVKSRKQKKRSLEAALQSFIQNGSISETLFDYLSRLQKTLSTFINSLQFQQTIEKAQLLQNNNFLDLTKSQQTIKKYSYQQPKSLCLAETLQIIIEHPINQLIEMNRSQENKIEELKKQQQEVIEIEKSKNRLLNTQLIQLEKNIDDQSTQDNLSKPSPTFDLQDVSELLNIAKGQAILLQQAKEKEVYLQQILIQHGKNLDDKAIQFYKPSLSPTNYDNEIQSSFQIIQNEQRKIIQKGEQDSEQINNQILQKDAQYRPQQQLLIMSNFEKVINHGDKTISRQKLQPQQSEEKQLTSKDEYLTSESESDDISIAQNDFMIGQNCLQQIKNPFTNLLKINLGGLQINQEKGTGGQISTETFQKQIFDYHDEFMNKLEDFSQSWRDAIKAEKRYDLEKSPIMDTFISKLR